jgi:hypothetical protein
MILKQLVVVLASAALAIGLTSSAIAGDKDGEGPMGLTRDAGLLTWDDQDGEAGYHVYGSVDYWTPDPCASFGNPDIERIEFDEELPADTTSYQLPAATDSRLSVLKGLTFRVDAVDSSGAMINSDASGFSSDAFCTPEEIAAAGSGPSPASDALSLATATLAAFGAIAVGGGLLMRRSRVR